MTMETASRHAAPSTAPRIPARHGSDRTRAEKAARMILGQMPSHLRFEPDPADWAQLGQGLLQGDEAADKLVAWMRASDTRKAWVLVEQALNAGIHTIPDAPEALQTFFNGIEARPAWVNDELLREGARACAIGGLAGLRALLVTGLLAGYQLAAINQTLLATGALEKGAARRLAETTKWWIDVTTEGAMDRFGSGFKSTVRVRLIHAMVRSHVSQQASWNMADLGLPVNQTDMQATYLGFSTVYLLGMKLIGVPLLARERKAVMHLWRYIAWVNGVDEAFLHDLADGENSGLRWLYQNLLSQRMADRDSARLAVALIEEPLSRDYGKLSWYLGPYNRSIELSMARACMNNDTLRSLRLSIWYLPWYPLMMIPFNAVLHRVARLMPGGLAWLIGRGRAQQLGSLEPLFGRHQAHGLRDIHAVKVAEH